MTADKVVMWDGKKIFAIIVLVAAAVVMTAAVFDVAPSTETPAAERKAAPDADGTTAAKPGEHRVRAKTTTTPGETARTRVGHASAAEEGALVHPFVEKPAKTP